MGVLTSSCWGIGSVASSFSVGSGEVAACAFKVLTFGIRPVFFKAPICGMAALDLAWEVRSSCCPLPGEVPFCLLLSSVANWLFFLDQLPMDHFAVAGQDI